MKVFKKILLYVASLILVLMIAVVSVGVWAYKNPQAAWNQIQHYILPEDLKITWEQIHLDLNHLSGWNFQVDLKLTTLKITKASPHIDFPIDQLEINTSVFPFGDPQRLLVHNLIVSAPQKLLFIADPTKTSEDSNPFEQLQTVQDYIIKFFKLAKLEDVAVKVKQISLESAAAPPTLITIELQKDHKATDEDLYYIASVDLSGGIKIESLGKVSFSTEDGEKIHLNIKLDVEGKGIKLSQDIVGSLGESNEINSTGKFSYKNKTTVVQAEPQLKIKMQAEGVNINLDAKILGFPNQLVKVDEIHAELKIPFEKNKTWSDKPSQFTFMTPLKLLTPKGDDRTKLEKLCGCQIPQVIKAEVEGPIWLSNFLMKSEDDKSLPLLDFKFQVESISNTLFTLKTAGQLQMHKQKNAFAYKPTLNVDAQILSFKRFAKVMDHYKVLIPSPLDVLDGKVLLKIDGPVSSEANAFTFPLIVDTNLTSPRQVVNLSLVSEGKLAADFKSAHIETLLSIHDLQLELPPLSPTKGNPRIISDRRILLKPKEVKKESPFKLTMSFEVMTDRAGGIRLLSEYFKPYLPLTINIKNTNGLQNSGSVKIETFDIEYIRRKVTVEKMAISLSDKNNKLIYVDGRASVQQTEYKIFIDVHGLASKPNIVLTSEPDLPRSEIINVLIYDRTSEQLVSADVKTAGQVDAAMADKAIGLFGLWAFAATPIKSFSYNPSTKIYSAVVELGEGVTAGIGTSWESATQLSLQKRVSRNWILAAAWTPADQNGAESTKLVLQWEKRIE